MRRAGRISDWNDDKGYGFVVPHDGGERAFVHIKAFQAGPRRPVDGDLVSYAVARDGRGRANAVEVRFAGQRIDRRKPRRPFPRAATGVAALLAAVAAAMAGWLPWIVAAGYLLLGGCSYVLYAVDKKAAARGARRTPEATLHAFDWPAAGRERSSRSSGSATRRSRLRSRWRSGSRWPPTSPRWPGWCVAAWCPRCRMPCLAADRGAG